MTELLKSVSKSKFYVTCDKIYIEEEVIAETAKINNDISNSYVKWGTLR